MLLSMPFPGLVPFHDLLLTTLPKVKSIHSLMLLATFPVISVLFQFSLSLSLIVASAMSISALLTQKNEEMPSLVKAV